MADKAAHSIVRVRLVQFKSKEPPKSNLVRELPDEKIDEAMARQKRNRGLPEPVVHLFHTGVIPQKLLQFLEGLELADARYQRRFGIREDSVGRHILETYEYREEVTDKKRAAALAKDGTRYLQSRLAERWAQVRVTEFPNVPGLMSILFVQQAEHPKGERPIDDTEAAKFGMIVTRRGDK